LIQVSLPWVDVEDSPLREIEIFRNTEGAWIRYRILKHGPDGRCLLKELKPTADASVWNESRVSSWCDLSLELYRWVV